jgi:hypothetical protein
MGKLTHILVWCLEEKKSIEAAAGYVANTFLVMMC